MKRYLVAIMVTGALAACASGDDFLTPPRMDAKPAPFPYPGIYNGPAKGGQITMMLGADGRGRECVRTLTGRVTFGDLVYTGPKLLTETLALDVTLATEHELVLAFPSTAFSHPDPAALRKVAEAPSTCRDFFSKAR